MFMQTVDKNPVVFTVAAINKGAVQHAKLTQHFHVTNLLFLFKYNTICGVLKCCFTEVICTAFGFWKFKC